MQEDSSIGERGLALIDRTCSAVRTSGHQFDLYQVRLSSSYSHANDFIGRYKNSACVCVSKTRKVYLVECFEI